MSCESTVKPSGNNPIEIVPVIATYDTEGNLKPFFYKETYYESHEWRLKL